MNKQKMLVTALFFSMLLQSKAGAVLAQDQGRPPDLMLTGATRSQVIEGVIRRFNQSYIFPEAARAMEQSIRARMQKGEYDKITSPTELAETLTANMREVSNDSHITVFFRNTPLPPMNEIGTEVSPAERENLRRNYAQINNGFL